MQNIFKTLLIFIFTLCFVFNATAAGYFDGQTPLLCSVQQLFECDPPNGCLAVTPAQIQGFSHFDIDFNKKEITRPGEDSQQKSLIKSVEKGIDNKLFIQGIEDGKPDQRDGAGWTISIMDPEGTMVMAVAGDGFAVVGLGFCVPKP